MSATNRRPLRILHVIDSLHLGGAQEVVMNLATSGRRDRYHHEVATLHGHGVYWDRMSARGIPLHSLSPHKLLPVYLPKLATLLLQTPFDILHCHLVASNILAKPIGALCQVPVLINHDHTNDAYRDQQKFRLLLDARSNRLATHIIAVSASCRDFLESREGVPKHKITLVPNAIDLARFSPDSGTRESARKALRIPNDVPVVAGVGRLNPQKNFSQFLEIARAVSSKIPNVHFLLAGSGPEEQMLREKAKSLGLGERVTFTGYVADTRNVYLAADVLMMPSRFEGLPMTLLEAMAMEVPVVASSLDGMAEVVHDGHDGFLVPRDSTELFVQNVTSLLENPKLGREIGEAARRKIQSHYSAERMSAQVESIYERFFP